MKNRFSYALAIFTLVAAMTMVLASLSETSVAASQPTQSGEKGCDIWSCWFGCCDAQGNCHTEGSSEYCGYYGESCESCEVPTPYCFNEGVYAQCTPCNFLTCPLGCCGDDGLCHEEQTPEFCGLAGSSCNTCTAPDQFCYSGICLGCEFLTCPFGCCDADSNCHTEGSSEYCGWYGESCESCEVPTPYCFNEGVYAQCTPCNFFTCPTGCCGDDGLCHEEDNPDFCGYAGVSCDTCTGGTPNCWGGLCVGCDAITCIDGCCTEDNVCHRENTPDLCGITGTSCFSCGGDTPNCLNGYCVGCSDQFPCDDGCCDFRTSLCHEGDSNYLCGGVGTMCDNCEIDGLFCYEGLCVSCDAGTCYDGCCDGNGGCRPGTEDNFCGAGATGCINCAEVGQVCVGYVCMFPGDDTDDDVVDDVVDDDTLFPACSTANCRDGCCQNQQCWPGNLDDKCGKTAAACQDCSATGDICVDNVCVTPDDDATDDASDDDFIGSDDSALDDDAGSSSRGHLAGGTAGCGC